MLFRSRFPLPAPVICLGNIAAAVVSAAVLFAVLHTFLNSHTDRRRGFREGEEKLRLHGCVLQVVQGKFYQVIVAYIGIIEIVKTYAEPVYKFRKFLQMSCMETCIRVLGGIGKGVCKVLIQITPFFDSVCLLKLILRERDGNIVLSNLSFYC